MFQKIIYQFQSNLNSLRDFVDAVDPFLTQKLNEDTIKNRDSLVPLWIALSKLKPEDFTYDSLKLEEKIKKENRFDFQIIHDEVDKSSVSIRISNDHDRVFSKAIGSFIQVHQQIQYLYNTSLISLISSSEWFISQLLHTYYENFPGALGKEKHFSLDDLKSFGTIEDATNYLIEKKIEDILRASIKDWLAYFKSSPHNITMNFLDSDEDLLIEAALKRNLLIHNNGIVNSLFLEKLPKKLKGNYELKRPISVGREYLEEVITVFEKNFVLISLEVWKNLNHADEGRGEFLIDIIYQYLLSEKFLLSESFSCFLMQDKNMSEEKRLIATINYWQSKKWLNKFSEVEQQIKTTDFSAKKDIFKLAKLSLLDENEQFFDLLPKVIKSDELKIDDLKTWPLFKKIRTTKLYDSYINKV